MIICIIANYTKISSIPITPFEYSGAVLALILVLRVNAGHEQWWEARKIWGSIVNQSRNLALTIYSYSKTSDEKMIAALKWVAIWPYIIKDSLRRENSLERFDQIICEQDLNKMLYSENKPMFVSTKISHFLSISKDCGMDAFAFLRAETEWSQLIDAYGACERIRNTRMPLVLAIKTRRFILPFLMLLPFALFDRTGWLTPLIVALASYPLFSLDEIGAELQNPFSKRNLSHLPLDLICKNISSNVLGLIKL